MKKESETNNSFDGDNSDGQLFISKETRIFHMIHTSRKIMDISNIYSINTGNYLGQYDLLNCSENNFYFNFLINLNYT